MRLYNTSQIYDCVACINDIFDDNHMLAFYITGHAHDLLDVSGALGTAVRRQFHGNELAVE